MLRVKICELEKFFKSKMCARGRLFLVISKDAIKIFPSSGSFEIKVLELKGKVQNLDDLKLLASKTIEELEWNFLKISDAGYLENAFGGQDRYCDVLLKTIYEPTSAADENEDRKFDIGLKLERDGTISIRGISRSIPKPSSFYSKKVEEFKIRLIKRAKMVEVIRALQSVGELKRLVEKDDSYIAEILISPDWEKEALCV